MASNSQTIILKRPGTINDGMKYEKQVIALLASRLAQDNSIHDYWIISSPKHVNGFDDIITVIEDIVGERYALMFQLKHSDKKMRLITRNPKNSLGRNKPIACKDTKYMDIPLYKYLETYNKCMSKTLNNKELQDLLEGIPLNNYYFGMFTNMGKDVLVDLTKEAFTEIQLVSKTIPKGNSLEYISTSECFYSPSPDVPFKDYEKFFSNFYFLIEQSDSIGIYKDLQANIPEFTNNMIDNLCSLIGRSMNDEVRSCSPLTKTKFFENCLEVRLSQTLSVQTKICENLKTMEARIYKMWQHIFEKYNVTMIEGANVGRITEPLYSFYEQRIREEYKLFDFSWYKCVENCFRLDMSCVDMNNRQITNLIDLLIYMWKENKIPLVVDSKTKTLFKNVISTLSKNKHQYVLDLNENEKIDIPNVKVFKSAHDLVEDSFFGKILDLKVSLQGRDAVPLREVIGDSSDILKAISPLDILEWTYNNDQSIQIGKQLKKSDEFYINRHIFVSGEVLVEQNVPERLKFGLTAISNEPGTGKSTVIGSMAVNCKRTDYVLNYNLADCCSDLQSNSSRIHSEPVDFFFEKCEKSPNKLLKTIFEYHKSSKRLILFIDSFDEILPLFAETVTRILKKMLEITVLITTRTQAEPELKQRFKSVNIIKLKDLDQNDVCCYFQKLGIPKKTYENIPNGMLTIPLHLVMLASIYKNKSNDDTNVMLVDIYEVFIDEKVRIYFQKINIEDENNQFRMKPENAINIHMEIALVYIFGKEKVKKLKIIREKKWKEMVKNFNEYKMALGILSSLESQDGSDQIRFVHKTFAEYFVARWLFESSNINTPSPPLSLLKDVIENTVYIRIYKFLCELKMKEFQSVFESNVDNIKLTREFLINPDHWNLLPLQWGFINLYHSSDGEETEKMDLFERLFVQSVLATEEKDLSILGRCFDHGDLYWAKLVKIAKKLNREYISRLGNFLKNLSFDGGEVIFDKEWYSNYVNLLSKFGINREISRKNEIAVIHFAALLGNKKIVTFILDSSNVNLNELMNNGDSVLHTASSRGNKEIIKMLLDHKASPNMRNITGKTSLHLACMRGNMDIITSLLQENADISLKDNEGKNCFDVSNGEVLDSLLLYVCKTEADCMKTKKLNMIRLLLQHKAKPNLLYKNGRTCLHLMCERGDVEVVQTLLRNNADPYILDDDEKSCLDISKFKENPSILSLLLYDACLHEKTTVVRFLLEYKADPHRVDDKKGFTSLHVACKNGNLQIVKELLSHNANPKVLNKKDENCLHIACQGNNVGIVGILLSKNLDPNQQTANRSSCLHIACENGNIEIVQMLLKHKANPKLMNSEGKNCLHAACCGNNIEIVRLMLHYELDLNHRTENGSTCLHFACANGNLDIVNMLLDHHIDPKLLNNNGENSLHAACSGNNIDVVTRILKFDLDPHQPTSNGSSGLHLACKKGSMEIVEKLLYLKLDPTLLNRDKENCLHAACRSRNIAIVVKLMLEFELDPNQQTSNGSNCLHLASETGDQKIVQMLLNRKVDPTLLNKAFGNSLHIACHHNNINIIKLLLKHNEPKLDPNQKTKEGFTCLHLGCENGNMEVVKIFLDLIDHNIPSYNNENYLHAACKGNNVNIVEKILNHKILRHLNPNEKNWDGSTCLHFACENGNMEIVDTLLRRKADPSLLNNNKENSLHAACRGVSTSTSLIKLMLKYNPDPNQKNWDGSTCLHLACENLNVETVKILLQDYSADPKLLNNHAENCLHIASRNNNTDVVKLLLNYNFDINKKTQSGSTYLHFACANGNLKIIRELLKRGADPNLLNNRKENSLHLALLQPSCNENSRREIVEILLEHKVDINYEMEYYGTALHIACENGYSNVVDVLLSRDADPYQTCRRYKGDCFYIASEKKLEEISHILNTYKKGSGKGLTKKKRQSSQFYTNLSY